MNNDRYHFFATSAPEPRIESYPDHPLEYSEHFGEAILTDSHSSKQENAQPGNQGLQLPPWELRHRYGLVNALYLTIKDVLLVPGRFFQRMPSQMGIAQPLLFAILLGVAGTFIAWMYSLVSASVQLAVFDDFSQSDSSFRMFFIFLTSPFWVAIAIFLQTALTHAVLRVLNGGRLGFEATFRVVAYSEATSVLLLIPICGSWLAIIWSLVILIMGLYNIHDTDPWKAIVAVLAPMLICLSALGGSLVAWMAMMS